MSLDKKTSFDYFYEFITGEWVDLADSDKCRDSCQLYSPGLVLYGQTSLLQSSTYASK